MTDTEIQHAKAIIEEALATTLKRDLIPAQEFQDTLFEIYSSLSVDDEELTATPAV